MNRAVFFDRDGVLNELVHRDGGLFSPQTFDQFNIVSTSKVVINRLKKNGFLIPTNKWEDKIKIDETFKVNNPKDKIIIIHNHGSSYADVKVKDCFWVSQIRNFAYLAGNKINEKEIMVYVHCQNHLEGDLGAKLSKTK